MIFGWLHAAGVLGINARNARYISRYNPRRFFPNVDDKLKTKALCKEHGIPSPQLFGVVQAHGELRGLGALLAPREQFVIKPVRGAMGNGVLVIAGRDASGHYRKPSGATLDAPQLRHYVSGILSGLHSLSGHADRAMIEHRVQLHPAFEAISHGGVPDIRVIVLKGVPAMAMVRLPTRRSDGRANLHQGAIAAGIDLATGRTHHPVQGGVLIARHPDTGQNVLGVDVPCWDEILRIAAVSADMTGLGYLGVDVVLDAALGPQLLELNARPGLAVQIANFRGLLGPFSKIEATDTSRLDPVARVALAKELAGATPAQEPDSLPLQAPAA